jgi:hypothetical protein
MRKCIQCECRLGRDDLLRKESRGMEAARVSMGLDGLFFRYYCCPRCGRDHVFLEVIPLPGEAGSELAIRKESLRQMVAEIRRYRTTFVVAERSPI